MSVEFFCPFQTLITVFESLTDGQKTAIVKFEPMETKRISAKMKGVTIFPERSDLPPLVLIRSDIPVWGALDIMAHELSHVAMGSDKVEHGDEWKNFYKELFEGYKTAVESQNLILDIRLGTVEASDELRELAQRAVESQEALADTPVDFEALAQSIVESVESELPPLLEGLTITSVDQGVLISVIHKLEKLYQPFSNDLALSRLQIRQILGIPDHDLGDDLTNLQVALDLLLKQGKILRDGKYYKWVA